MLKRILIIILFIILVIPVANSHYSRFYWGQCTRFVAQKKNVEWGGNAKDWYNNAKKMGYKVGKTPQEGAIVVYSWGKYGHVGIVEKIIGENMIIEDMNFYGKNIISKRIEKVKNKDIKGYIYY